MAFAPAPSRLARRKRPLAALCGAIPVLVIAAVTTAACSQMPHTHGSRAKLMDGINTPRDRNDMDITIHRFPVTAWPKCLEILADKSTVLAVASALTLTVYHACARVPRDASLKPGQRPWCIVAVPEGDDDALEHELRHCEGWDHPHTFDQAPKQAHDQRHAPDDKPRLSLSRRDVP